MTVAHGAVAHHATWTGYRFHAIATRWELFAGILEGWEYMRPTPTEIRELESGVYLVRGELHSKHPATENVIVSQYEQRLEIRDGLMAKGRMVIGSTARG